MFLMTVLHCLLLKYSIFEIRISSHLYRPPLDLVNRVFSIKLIKIFHIRIIVKIKI